MAKIAVLSELVQNRIAAGEVVERPASVVKELTENALDAGASRIDIEIEQGGRRRIRVSDDGCGMSSEDLAVALERFATSKLRSETDLAGVSTLGFRGEALPSMASVAEMEITTRTADSDSGFRLFAEPGVERKPPEPAPCSPGTIVELRALFARTPARLKFLKSDSAETSAVAEIVERLAVSRPDVGFRLQSNDRELLSAPRGQDLRARVASVYGKEPAREMIEVAAGEEEWLSISGLTLGPGGKGRRDSRRQLVFLNGRPIRDRVVSHAIISAYDTLLPTGRKPVYALMLDVDPAQVDVNVHPAKHEVRFRSSGSIHEFVRRSIRESLRNAGADVSIGAPTSYSSGGGHRSSDPAVDAPAVNRAVQRDLWGPADEAMQRPFVAEPSPTFTSERTDEANGNEPPIGVNTRVVGILRTGYVLVETDDDLRIIDPHAIHERLIYESLGEDSEGRGIESQSLLVPETVDLSAAELATFDRASDALQKLGFDAETFGGRTVVVRSVPVGVPSTASGEILREVLEDLESGGRGDTASLIDRIRKSVACRAAVKLGARLDPSEIEWLLRDAQHAPKTCPHGRPFAWVLELSEIARRLGR